jgi:hypothetical protein
MGFSVCISNVGLIIYIEVPKLFHLVSFAVHVAV